MKLKLKMRMRMKRRRDKKERLGRVTKVPRPISFRIV
jgi:hypothetical protein